MKLYKCLWQTLDLDHVLAVSDYNDGKLPGFSVTLALRDKPLYFTWLDDNAADLLSEPNVKAAREKLIRAWQQRGEELNAKAKS